MSAKHVRAREPNLTRRGLLGHPRTLLLALLAIVFTAYVLGYLPQLDVLFGSAIDDSRSHGLLIVGPVILLIVGLFVVFVLLLILGFLGNLLTSIARSFTFVGRKHTTVQQFTTLAQMEGLSARVAKETYELLKPHYPAKMCIGLEDQLRQHLGLNDEGILFLQSRLLHRCDRREVLSFSVESIQTVFDLMQHVEGAPSQHVSGAVLRRRSVDLNPAALADRRAASGRRAVETSAGAAGPPNARTNPDRRSTSRRIDDRSGLQAAQHEANTPDRPPTGPPIEPATGPPGSVSRPGFFPTPLLDPQKAVRTDAGIIERHDAIIAPLPTSKGEASSGDSVFPIDPHYLPPRRRERSGMLRRVTDLAANAAEPDRRSGSSLDDPDFRSRARPDYSGILRRSSDSTEAGVPAGEPTATQISAQIASRRLGDTGGRPRPGHNATSPMGTVAENTFLAPRRLSETGFRRRITDPPAIEPEPDERPKERP